MSVGEGCDLASYNRLIGKLVHRLDRGMEGQEHGDLQHGAKAKQISDREREADSSSIGAAVSGSEEEDTAFLKAVYDSIGKSTPGSEAAWDAIAAKFVGKSSVQCLLRYLELSGATIPPPPSPQPQRPVKEQEVVAAVARHHLPQSDNDTITTHDDSCHSSAVSLSEPAARKRKRGIEGESAWSDEERTLLQKLVEQYRDRSPRWNEIAANFGSKHSAVDCLSQWQSITNSPVIKGKGSWTPEEDQILRSKREELGRKWSQIAKFLPGRQGKQCRERYVNHLNPELKKGEWTDAEEAVLISCHQQFGNRWASISKQLPGRSDNDVKNHWYSTIQRKFSQHGKDNLVQAAVQQVQMMHSMGAAPIQKQSVPPPWPAAAPYDAPAMLPDAHYVGGSYAPPQQQPMPYYHGHVGHSGQGPPPPHHQQLAQQQHPPQQHPPHQHQAQHPPHPHQAQHHQHHQPYMYPSYFSQYPESRDGDIDDDDGRDDSEDEDEDDDQKPSASNRHSR